MTARRRSHILSYTHTQRAPLCVLLYGIAIVLVVTGWSLRNQEPFHWLFPVIGILMLVLAASFHYLRVQDEGDRLSIRFGPLPLFQRSIRYNDIISVERGRTTILDGWGIHLSLRGGWIWNIWGRDCVVLQMRKDTFTVGTDDGDHLIEFIRSRIGNSTSGC